jgi:hypothetical protein
MAWKEHGCSGKFKKPKCEVMTAVDKLRRISKRPTVFLVFSIVPYDGVEPDVNLSDVFVKKATTA